MSLDKGIKSGKEKRKPYRGPKSFDSSCRNHGSCDYCRNNRLYQDRRDRAMADEQIKLYLNYKSNGGQE